MLSLLPKELVTFAKFVLNRFFVLAARNDKAYVELLFWKNVGAVRDMTEGYSKDRCVYIVCMCTSLYQCDCGFMVRSAFLYLKKKNYAVVLCVCQR